MELKQKADVEQDEQSQEEVAEAIFKYAAELMGSGMPPAEVKAKLVEQGLGKETADIVVDNLTKHMEEQKSGGSGAMGWLGLIGFLILINVLSYIFDWPFWIY